MPRISSRLSAPELTQVVKQTTIECVRQGATDLRAVSRFILAYKYALEVRYDYEAIKPHEDHLLEIAIKIDPRSGAYRRVPVVFDEGGSATSHEHIPRKISDLFEWLHDTSRAQPAPAEFAYEFLRIHPFVDANGRTAFILFNWLNDTLRMPISLPLFEFA